MRFKYAAVMLAIRDDFCAEEAIQALHEQGVSNIVIISPRNYWTDNAAQDSRDFWNLVGIAARQEALVHQAFFKSDHPTAGPLYTEALYRNCGCEILEEDPEVDFILTVDADEFWLPGTLEHIDEIAVADHTICLPGIPVVAGLPVSGAKDGILVATPRGTRFTWCRVTEGPRITGTKPVIHFSCTRRTNEEVIEKCRKSAHYVDPYYDFEGWIKNTLPNVHVGMKDVHMYKSEQNIWPELRAWTPEELAALPPSILRYVRRQ